MAEDSIASVAVKPPKPIIIVKRKRGGGQGHHGGAWKVARIS